MVWHGIGFHSAAMASTTQWWPAAASTSRDGFHGMVMASGGIDQQQPDDGGLESRALEFFIYFWKLIFGVGSSSWH
jgi:hypothetical protein